MMKRQLIVVVGLFSFGYIQTTQIKNDERNGMSEAQKKTLYYVTSNPSKVSRCAQFIPSLAGLELKQVDVDLYEEQTEDQQAIALAKAFAQVACKEGPEAGIPGRRIAFAIHRVGTQIPALHDRTQKTLLDQESTFCILEVGRFDHASLLVLQSFE